MDTKNKLVIDFSILAHQNWHHMFSPDYIAQYDEVKEWSRLVALQVAYLVKRYPSDEILIALDGKSNFRAGLVDAYYKHHTTFYMEYADNHKWYADVDGVLYSLTLYDISNDWKVKKLTKKEIAEVELGDSKQYVCYENGNTPQDLLDRYPEIPTNVRDFPVWDGLKKVIPFYKGNRSSAKWVANTPKKEFKELIPLLGNKLATMVGGVAIMADEVEADDVIGQYILTDNSASHITLVTRDSDLDQLFAWHEDLVVFNPATYEEHTLTKDQALYRLWCKTLGGDTADNIKGCKLVDPTKVGVLPTVKWDTSGQVVGGKKTVALIDKVLESGTPIDRCANLITAQLDGSTIIKNLDIVWLTQIPALLAKNTVEVLKYVATPLECTFGWADFGVEPAEVLVAEQKAITDLMELQEASYGVA